MSRKNNLKITDRVTACCGILSLNNIDLTFIKQKFDEVLFNYKQCQCYYFILHDSDDDTSFKHIHYILKFKGQQTFQRVLNVISEGLQIDINAVQIDRLNSLGGYLRYMLHIDKESQKAAKHVYDLHEIVSSQSFEIIQSYLDSNDDEVSAQMLINLVIDTTYEYEIMEIIGIKLFHKYRYEIKSLREEKMALMNNRDKQKELPF